MDQRKVIKFNSIRKLAPAEVMRKRMANERCGICMLKGMHPTRYGGLVSKTCKLAGSFECHYFCLLSASEIMPRQFGGSGIKAFLVWDVIDSLFGIRDKTCVYCRRYSAPIQCCAEGCNRWFHYICGYTNSCLVQLTGSCLAFCDRHLPDRYRHARRQNFADCDICRQNLPLPTDASYNPVGIVGSCGGSRCAPAWMHRECVQRMAYAARHDMACPMCHSEHYPQYAKECGIFVPQGGRRGIRRNDTIQPGPVDETNMAGCDLCGRQAVKGRCIALPDLDKLMCEECKSQSFIDFL
ncbi:PHD finger protein 7-like [Anopheles ziemanni]|uniref:PHD finger protein 7-like n=1 Tax=Anopheles coustani TaxID=139045 RepID=UPI002659882E|nr:PHD finger protein 7-like [Anopheles coustani]XP_058175786.1 PHD finger protein 7-like [Anopheles ziemanni]